ncbi:IVSP3-like protein [Lissonota sp. PSUC_FEM 10030012]|nr:IVSP3-like protein [Lissonota sp. PSUC_FEM 10030012]
MYKFYTFLVKTEEIVTDELYRGRFNGFRSENINFDVPESDQPISWEHLRTLCRLINMFNRMQLENVVFQSVLNKHAPDVIGTLDTLQKTNPALKSLSFVVDSSIPLDQTAKIHVALDALVHKPHGNSDERMKQLFKLNKNHSFVFVRGVMDAAEEIFESIYQYLPESEKIVSSVIDLMAERIPERVLHQTLWKNINVAPIREIHASDAEWLQQRLQKIGSLAWEFNCRFLSQEYSNLTLTPEVLKKVNIPEFNEQGKLRGELDDGRMVISNDPDKTSYAHSIYNMSNLLISSSKTLVHCPCSSKTIEFVRNIFTTCDSKTLRAHSTVNARVFVFAAHEMSKYPFARPTERYNFRNMFTSYSQSCIFGRPLNAAFVPEHVNELSYVFTLRDAGLEVNHASMLYLLLSTKNEKSIPDSVYTALLTAINVSYGATDDPIDFDPKRLKKLANSVSDSVKYRVSVYEAIATFCIVYTLRMAYFTEADVHARHLIPIIRLLDINTENKKYPITAACLQTFLNNLPIRPAWSGNLTTQPLENIKGVEIRAIFKYFTILTNVFLMEKTQAQHTMVDFIQLTPGASMS